jgi:hypothetical protein
MRKPFSLRRKKIVSKLLERHCKDRLMRRTVRKKKKNKEKGNLIWQRSKGSNKSYRIWRIRRIRIKIWEWEEGQHMTIIISCQLWVLIQDRDNNSRVRKESYQRLGVLVQRLKVQDIIINCLIIKMR